MSGDCGDRISNMLNKFSQQNGFYRSMAWGVVVGIFHGDKGSSYHFHIAFLHTHPNLPKFQ